jgi:hypothetical protein
MEVEMLPAVPPVDKPFLRIVSPANGAVVRPGQKLAVKVAGSGEYPGLGILGEEVAGAIMAPMGKPPWIISVALPAQPGKISLTATGTTVSGTEVNSDTIEIDVEPAEIPPVDFEPPTLSISRGDCVRLTDEGRCGLSLRVHGTYPDGTRIYMNNSTRIKFISQIPSIAAVSRDGSTLYGISSGSTKIVVFGKFKVDVTVH